MREAPAADLTYMRRALRLALRGSGRVSPDPLAGAVVVDRGKIVGEAFHQRADQSHAEVVAMARAADGSRGATLYLTLEPCSHQDRTPPCTEAIVGSGIARVVVAVRDPDPRVDGKGLRALRAAGIEVDTGVLEDEAKRVNEAYLTRIAKGRPFVTLTLSTTLDGRVAAPGRRVVTGKPALREVHRLRDRSDAVLVDVGTVLADDPELTVREVRGRDPMRVVLDAEARTPASAKVVRADPQRTVIFVARDADQRRTKRLRDAGALVATLPRARDGKGLDAAAGLRWLAEHGLNAVLCEGGPQVAASLLNDGAVDRLILIYAPLVGGDGQPAVEGAGPIEARATRVRRLGADVMLEADL